MRRILYFTLILLLSACTLLPATRPEVEAALISLHFIDVGQGDAVLIKNADGRAILYDGGRNRNTVLEYLLELNIESLELVIASHPDADHIGGLADVIEHFRPRFYMDNGMPAPTQTYERLLQAVQNAGSQLLEPSGQRIQFGDASLQILPPPMNPAWSRNDNSIGLILTLGKFSAAMTGDAEDRQFRWWLETVPELLEPVQIYKSSHHGSPYGDTEQSVNTWLPQVVVISVGANNPYGHPAANILNLYQRIGATIFRTDVDGTVRVTGRSDGTYSIVAAK